jgi:hypothetical protein
VLKQENVWGSRDESALGCGHVAIGETIPSMHWYRRLDEPES